MGSYGGERQKGAEGGVWEETRTYGPGEGGVVVPGRTVDECTGETTSAKGLKGGT